MSEDHLITCLIRLCLMFADDPLKGRYTVAARAGLSEQYLYQIIERKPMANGAKRSIGKVAREKLTKAFPHWLPTTTTTDKPLSIQETTPADYKVKQHHSRNLVQRVSDIAEKIDDKGLHTLIDMAECLARSHPLAKAKPQLLA